MTQQINKIKSLNRASVLSCLLLLCVLAVFPFSCSWAATPDSMNSSDFGPREMPQNSHAAFDDPNPSTALAESQKFHPELIAPAAGEESAGDGAENDDEADAPPDNPSVETSTDTSTDTPEDGSNGGDEPSPPDAPDSADD